MVVKEVAVDGVENVAEAGGRKQSSGDGGRKKTMAMIRRQRQ